MVRGAGRVPARIGRDFGRALVEPSSFASIVGLVELTRAGLLVRETVGDSLRVFLLLAAIYFVINYSISSGALALERRFRFVH